MKRAFTIVELIIVIVVIGILSAIVVVGYKDISTRAAEASIQSDLKGSSAKIANIMRKEGRYPDAMGGTQLVESKGNTLVYKNTRPLDFCLEGSLTRSGKQFYIDQDDKLREGACPGGVWRDLAVGGFHTCGITFADDVYCWGADWSNQLGWNGGGYEDYSPVKIERGEIPEGSTIVQLVAGDDDTCALTSDQWVYCWGDNYYGELGTSDTQEKYVPTKMKRGAIPAGVTIRAVSIGAEGSFVCVLGSNGWVYCSGYNNYTLGDGTNINRKEPVAILRGSIPAGETITQITSASNSTCMITNTQKVHCIGYAGPGNGTDGDFDAVPHGPGVQGDRPAGVTFQQISTSLDFTCGLGTDGIVYCWGGLVDGRYMLVPTLTGRGELPIGHKYTQITTWFDHVCGLATDNWVYCWGNNNGSRLGDGTSTHRHTPVRVKRGAVPLDASFTKVGVGTRQSCALATDAEIYCWGSVTGDGTPATRAVPVQVRAPGV